MNHRNYDSNPAWPPWAWMLIGFAPGLLLAALIYVDKRTDEIITYKSIDSISILSNTKYPDQQTDAKESNQEKLDNPDDEPRVDDDNIASEADNPASKNKIEFSFFNDLKKQSTPPATARKNNRAEKIATPQPEQKPEPVSEPDPDSINKVNTRFDHEAQPEKKTQLDSGKYKRQADIDPATLHPEKPAEKKPDTLVKNSAPPDVLANESNSDKHKKSKSVTDPNKSKIIRTTTQHNTIQADKPQLRGYILQAGSFRKKSHALKRKAELTKIGIESRINLVNIKSGQWFRVSVGPFHDYKNTQKQLKYLKRRKISAIPIKLKYPTITQSETRKSKFRKPRLTGPKMTKPKITKTDNLYPVRP